jgi:HK97 family phage prohead protease
MSEILNRHVDVAGFEIREDDDGHHLVGIVAPFGATYDAGSYLERFAPNAFDKTIQERGSRVPLLEQHATDRMPIGRAARWEKTNDGLIADFLLARTARADEARTLAMDGFVTGFSVGFVPIRTKTSEMNGRPLRTRTEVALDHVGFVRNPAYADAQLLSVRAYDPDDEDQVPRLAKYRHLMRQLTD